MVGTETPKVHCLAGLRPEGKRPTSCLHTQEGPGTIPCRALLGVQGLRVLGRVTRGGSVSSPAGLNPYDIAGLLNGGDGPAERLSQMDDAADEIAVVGFAQAGVRIISESYADVATQGDRPGGHR